MERNEILKRTLTGITTGKRAFGREKLTVVHDAVSTLTIPNGATYAFICIEAATVLQVFSDSSRVARYTIDGTDPAIGATAPIPDGDAIGIPLGHLDVLDIDEISNLVRFKIIKNENAGILYVHVQYYQ